MATAAPHVKVLRQLAIAKDEYLSGALDFTWESGKATVFVVFGQPSHAVWESDGRKLEGDAAIDAIVNDLPNNFTVGPWRRAMSSHETLEISLDELAEPFAQLAGSHVEEAAAAAMPDFAEWSSQDDAPDLGFGLADFPLLPLGRPLWNEAPATDVHLAQRVAELPASVVVLNGSNLRAAGVVSGGELIDAVWVDGQDHARGDTAAMALLGASEGTLAGYQLDPAEIAEALPALWRLPLSAYGIDAGWLDRTTFASKLQSSGGDAVLFVEAATSGVALFSKGRLAAVYSTEQRVPSQSPDALSALLTQPGALVRVLRRPAPPGLPEAVGSQSAHMEAVAEPVDATPDANGEGSQFVNFDDVKRELVQIGLVWLGDVETETITALILGTRPTIDDFVSTIDTIRGLRMVSHDPTVIQSMAHEMHRHAAERLCGA
jgi:hypothetical protein